MAEGVAAAELAVFSEDGSRLAVCSLDGELKVWSVATRTLVSRFTPEDARGGAIATASWSRVLPKHRKSGQKIAVAVSSKVVVWNAAKGREECVLSGVHSSGVSGLAWGPENCCLYSASEDKHVAVWDTKTWECNHKWKADKHGVKCISCHGDRDIVATAGRTIKLWNCDDYSLIKRFSGHATSVSSLIFIGDGLLISCARDDRVISLWSSEVKGSAAVASFTCEQEVSSCHVTVTMGTVHVVARTVEGVLHMFKYPLTNQIAAPISAHSTVQFTTGATSKGETPSPLPVLAVSLSSEGITVAHGSSLRPSIETLGWSECEGGRVCLVREKAAGLLLPGDGDTRTKNHKTQSRPVTVLGPGHMTSDGDHVTPCPGVELTSDPTAEAPLGSRMSGGGVASCREQGKNRVATAESLSRLLGQAVQSGDRSLLEEALRVRRENIIRQTLRRLPLSLILPLLRQLVRLLETCPSRGLELSLWVHHLLTQHSAYLITQPQLMAVLSSFYQVLETRSSVYNKLCRIHGKLGLMNIHDPEVAAEIVTQPLISATLGEEVLGHGESSEQSEGEELESDQSDSESDVAMDTEDHKHQDLT
ncbi:WD repeat-containing protein 43 [Geodia barretti]|uniref:WD repeat-containing protein 43 n=2 Tax=Geodia barretti TaxID=519541 RepID=A0AA35TK81_GEOBA|nr:WD repeat-containing protein 43 [Geodia barretti]